MIKIIYLDYFYRFVDVRGSLKARLPKIVFKLKCEQLYEEYLKQKNLEPAEEERVKFSNRWIRGWQEEYRVSLRHPNKRFSVSESVRKHRIIEFIKNIIRVRIFFEKRLNVTDVDIINGDQMPLHRNESAGQKTLTLRDCPTYVKENYMLSRERVTVYTQASGKKGLEIRPQFVFKGKGTFLQGRLNRPVGVTSHWSPKGSYRIETMKATIKTLPNLKAQNIFSQRQWAIYILDDYSVHVTEEVRRDLLARGYILVCMGGGITGDVQINDTHIHHFLKLSYRKLESELMAQQLQNESQKIPSPSRDDMMRMLVDSWDSLNVNVAMALKENFILNALDGSEDVFVSDKLFQLVGEEIVAFRTEEMAKEPPKTIAELLATITPPEGVQRASQQGENQSPADEGCELLDAEDGEIDNIENEDEEDEASDAATVPMEQESSSESEPDSTESTSANQGMLSTGHKGLPTDTDDLNLNKDAKFLNELGKLLNGYGKETSTQMLPHLCHMRSAYAKARVSVKTRLKSDSSLVHSLVASLVTTTDSNGTAITEESTISTAPTPGLDQPSLQMPDDHDEERVAERACLSLHVNDHVMIRYGMLEMPAVIVRDESAGLAARYFEKMPNTDRYTAQEFEYEVLQDDIIRNISAPKMECCGSRIFYRFTNV